MLVLDILLGSLSSLYCTDGSIKVKGSLLWPVYSSLDSGWLTTARHGEHIMPYLKNNALD